MNVAARTGLAVGCALAALGCSGDSSSAPTDGIATADAATVQQPATDEYAAALEHVNDSGLVDYAGLKANPEALNAYLTSVANLDPEAYESWSAPQQIAFWCNVYNAYTLKAIIEHYPIEASLLKSLAHPKNSIRQIDGVWDELQWPVMGRQMTLDNIEHDTLRKEFDEPRIHAALVCAAMGCPPLRDEPFEGDRLDEQLDDQMRRYLGVPERFRIDRDDDVVYLSSILKWYGEDFVTTYGTNDAFTKFSEVERAVLNAVTRYVDEAEYLKTADYTIKYLDYDWTLNEQP
jgi:hypothetical protein